jgi:hypothetical protein
LGKWINPKPVFVAPQPWLPITADDLQHGAPKSGILAVGDGDSNGAFHMLQTLDLAEMEFAFTGARLGPTVDSSAAASTLFLAQKLHCTISESEHGQLIAHITSAS